MMTLPKIVKRPERHYVYVPFTVRMTQMQKPAREGFPKLFSHIAEHKLKQNGVAFYNYRRINMAETLDVEAGVLVKAGGEGAGAVRAGVLPAGRFVCMDWHGHPDKLMPVTGMLVAWSRQFNEPFDVVEQADGDHFACRLEIYESDPEDEPDMNKWVTRLEFKLRD